MFDSILSITIRLASTAVMLGWGLSALGRLNGRGYLLAGLPALLLVGMLARRDQTSPIRFRMYQRLVRWWRGRRLLPLVYLLTFALLAIGSVLYEPNNFDALSYRSPKVLYWLDQGHWHWIKANYEAMNYTLPNFEWLTVPLFLLTHGFHAAVVINWIAFLLLPPLFFSLLRAFGTPGRVAYDWMWLFPSGYLIVMLAGGLGNDLAGLAAILAALHCANRFAATGRAGCLCDALLAAGFCTGVKLSNVPLVVFVGIILLGNLRWLRTRRLALVTGTVLGVLTSALIPMLLNLAHAGSVFGTTSSEGRTGSLLAGLLGNGVITLAAAVSPPVFPGATQLTHLLEHGVTGGWLAWIRAHYEWFNFKFVELPQEEAGGLGLGITLAFVLCLVLSWRHRKTGQAAARLSPLAGWQRRAWWGCLGFGLLYCFARLGTGMAFPRNMLPWFPLVLAPMIAHFGCAPVSRSKIWRWFTPLVSLSVLPAIFLTPSRPLIPAPQILRLAQKAGVPDATLQRMRTAYAVYAVRADPFAALTSELPREVRILGLVTDGSEPTASFWKPYGSHRCVYLLTDPDFEAARKSGVQYVVVSEACCQRYFQFGTARWLELHHGQALKAIDVQLVATWPATRYTLALLEK